MMIELERFLPYRLNRLASKISARTRREYRKLYDLTVPEWRVLAALAAKDAMTATAIGEYGFMHKTKVSRAIAALEARRWLKRSVKDANRREEFISLTTHGEQAFAEISTALKAFENQILEKLEYSQDDLLGMIAKIEKAL